MNETAKVMLERQTAVSEIANVEAFFYKMMTNVFCDMLEKARVQQGRHAGNGSPASQAGSIDPRALEDAPDWSHISAEQMLAAVARLPDEIRTTYELKVYEEMSGALIAQTLGIKVATVWTRLLRARNRLKELLTTDQEDRVMGERQ